MTKYDYERMGRIHAMENELAFITPFARTLKTAWHTADLRVHLLRGQIKIEQAAATEEQAK